MDSAVEIQGLLPGDVERVTSSVGLLFAEKSHFVAAFYDHMFEQIPQARAMFSDDLGHQKEMVLAVIATVLRGITKPETLSDVLERTVAKHEDMGVTPAHLDIAADALTRAAHKIFNDKLGAQSLDAWARVFRGLADLMKARMHQTVA